MILPQHYLESERIILRELSTEDAQQTYLDWFADAETTRFLSAPAADIDIQSLCQYIQQNNACRSSLLLGIFAKQTKAHIGNVRLVGIDTIKSRTSIGILIGEKTDWGSGIASEVLIMATELAHSELGIKRVFAGCHEENIGSVRAFEKAGYIRADALANELAEEDRWMDGVVIDHVMMVSIK
jgi:ribosomal-protein-alanine N-acetyltransferase